MRQNRLHEKTILDMPTRLNHRAHKEAMELSG